MRILLQFFFLAFMSCSQNIANLSLVSTNSGLDFNVSSYEDVGFVEGEDKQYIISFIPLGQIRIDRAISNTLIKNNLDFLTNASIEIETFYIPYLWGYRTYKLKGKGWKKNNSLKIKLNNPTNIKYDPLTGDPVRK